MTSNYFHAITPTGFLRPVTHLSHELLSCSPSEQFKGLVKLYEDCQNHKTDVYLFYTFSAAFIYALSKSYIPYLADYVLTTGKHHSSNPIERRVALIILLYFKIYFKTFVKIDYTGRIIKSNIPASLDLIIKILLSDPKIRDKKRITKSELLEILTARLPELAREFPWLDELLDLLRKIVQAGNILPIFDL